MGLRVANGPVSWGVDLPDKPGAPPWETVFSEISEAGYRWCELGPVGYLPDGTMIVINHARSLIGKTVKIVVSSTLQTAGGRLIFGELKPPAAASA